jgi:inner membrane transporter RhtA
VTIEFLGPLGVAVAFSRRWIDLLWVGLAAAGVALLTLDDSGSVTAAGVAFALLAAAAWAGYILLSAETGRRFPGSSGLALASVAATMLVLPVGITTGGTGLLRPDLLLIGAAIGLLSSVIPYTFELEALRRMPARVFGILMSLEPAVAALVGLVILGEMLDLREWTAIGCVVVACLGATRSQETPREAPEA